eukprot:scpid52851/ scgid13419/ 
MTTFGDDFTSLVEDFGLVSSEFNLFHIKPCRLEAIKHLTSASAQKQVTKRRFSSAPHRICSLCTEGKAKFKRKLFGSVLCPLVHFTAITPCIQCCCEGVALERSHTFQPLTVVVMSAWYRVDGENALQQTCIRYPKRKLSAAGAVPNFMYHRGCHLEWEGNKGSPVSVQRPKIHLRHVRGRWLVLTAYDDCDATLWIGSGCPVSVTLRQ